MPEVPGADLFGTSVLEVADQRVGLAGHRALDHDRRHGRGDMRQSGERKEPENNREHRADPSHAGRILADGECPGMRRNTNYRPANPIVRFPIW